MTSEHGATKLPNEILLSIFREFSVTYGTNEYQFNDEMRMLYRLCLTCKTFDAIARPILYGQFHQKSLPYRPSGKPLRPFVRTLVSRPDLASFIRHICLEVDHRDDRILDDHDSARPIRWKDWKLARNSEIDTLCDQLWPTSYTQAFLKEQGIPASKVPYWKDTSLHKYYSRAFVASMLIYLSPNIETLRVSAGDDFNRIIEEAKCEFAKKLYRCTFLFEEHYRGRDLQCWQSLLNKSRLKGLVAYSVDDFNKREAFSSFAPSSFTIEQMHLNIDWLTPESIRYITMACKGLRSLTIEWDSSPKRWSTSLYYGTWSLDVDYTAISKAINPSVKKLRLDWSWLFEQDYKGDGYPDFSSHSLIYLDVPEGAFFRDDGSCPNLGSCFPKTLETLIIGDVTENTIRALLSCTLKARQIKLEGDVGEENSECNLLLQKYKDTEITCTFNASTSSSIAGDYLS